ncbi:hypothetical protein RFI_26559, partial [Reticulomyxa filosa]
MNKNNGRTQTDTNRQLLLFSELKFVSWLLSDVSLLESKDVIEELHWFAMELQTFLQWKQYSLRCVWFKYSGFDEHFLQHIIPLLFQSQNLHLQKVFIQRILLNHQGKCFATLGEHIAKHPSLQEFALSWNLAFPWKFHTLKRLLSFNYSFADICLLTTSSSSNALSKDKDEKNEQDIDHQIESSPISILSSSSSVTDTAVADQNITGSTGAIARLTEYNREYTELIDLLIANEDMLYQSIEMCFHVFQLDTCPFKLPPEIVGVI